MEALYENTTKDIERIQQDIAKTKKSMETAPRDREDFLRRILACWQDTQTTLTTRPPLRGWNKRSSLSMNDTRKR